MPAKDLGTKFTCFKCGTKFYDLKKPEPVCPKCGADQREAVTVKPSKKSREKEPVKVEPEVEEAAGEEEEELPEAEAEEEEEEEEPEEDF